MPFEESYRKQPEATEKVISAKEAEVLKAREVKPKVDTIEMGKVEALSDLEEAFNDIKMDQPELQGAAFIAQLKELPPADVSALRDVIWGYPKFSAKGVEKFNGYVSKGAADDLAQLMNQNMASLKQVEEQYLAPQNVVDEFYAMASSLTEIGPIKNLGYASEEKIFVRFEYQVDGVTKQYDWQPQGSIEVPKQNT